MIFPRYDFFSDNCSGSAPEALSAFSSANAGYALPYGDDEITAQARAALQDLFDCEADVRFIPSGTAGNALACAMLCRSIDAVAAHRLSHMITHEAGAPGFFGQGLGIVALDGDEGKIDASCLETLLAKAPSVHRHRLAAVSLTNATECGTLYHIDEMRRLAGTARAAGLRVHLDGARLVNAVAAGFDLKAIARENLCDILVLGGTKAGAPMSDALLVFDRNLSRHLDTRLKQGGQLVAKGRMLAAPWLGLLTRDESGRQPWSAHAGHANAMARQLAQEMPFRIAWPVDANLVFVEMDEAILERLNASGWAVGRGAEGYVRFCCSWATTASAVSELTGVLRSLA